jgi:hypothetical protein
MCHLPLQIITGYPINLKIVPNSNIEVAIKEQVDAILMSSQRIEITMIVLNNTPMSPLK